MNLGKWLAALEGMLVRFIVWSAAQAEAQEVRLKRLQSELDELSNKRGNR